jgi:hypothetical protein
MSLSEHVQDLLAALPFNGIHRWLFHTACTIVEQTSLDDDHVERLLIAASRGARRKVSKREIGSAVADARRKCGGKSARKAAKVFAKAWPEVDPSAIEAIRQNGPGLYDLQESSPVRYDDEASHAEEVITALFPGILGSVAAAAFTNLRAAGEARGEVISPGFRSWCRTP